MNKSTTENRTAFDWIMFLLIHVCLISGIAYAGFATYGDRLGMFAAASAFIAGITSTYLYAKVVPGETIMKVLLGLAVAANAAYMVHNGAKAIGIGAYNDAQVKKFELGIAAAAGATSRSIARTMGASVKDATIIEKTFGDGVSTVAALLAFLEMSLAIIFFAVASKRVRAIDDATASPHVGGSVASVATPLPHVPQALPYYPPPVAARSNLGFSSSNGNSHSSNYAPVENNDPKARPH